MTKSENLTIMFTDIAGFSELVASMSRQENEDMMKRHDAVLIRMLRIYNGRHIKSIGDSFLIVFRSPTDAVLCAMAMHDALWEISQDLEERERIVIRIALNLGEVRLTRNDIYGEAVNITARLESVTPPGEIFLSESVYLSMNKAEVGAELVGKDKFKGFLEPIKYYKVPRGVKRTTVALKTSVGDDAEKYQYPYGGVHLYRTDKFQQFSSVLDKATETIDVKKKEIVENVRGLLNSEDQPKKAALHRKAYLFVGALVLVMLTGVVAYQMDSDADDQGGNEAQTVAFSPSKVLDNPNLVSGKEKKAISQLIKQQDVKKVESKVVQLAKQYPDDQYVVLLKGHLSFLKKEYSGAIKSYQLVIKENPDYANDNLMLGNTVSMFDTKSRKSAKNLLEKIPSENLTKLLSVRAAEEGLVGRYDAIGLLKKFKKTSVIDPISLNVLDFNELEKCEPKKKAFTNLLEINSDRAAEEIEKITMFLKSPEGKQVHQECQFSYLVPKSTEEKVSQPKEKPGLFGLPTGENVVEADDPSERN